MDHFPVLLAEALEYLAIRPDGVYVDCTAGLGGHTGAIARRLTTGRVISLDRDADSLELAKANCADCADRITFRHSSFSQLSETLSALGQDKVDGILADLGVSRLQLTSAERGFSLMQTGPLDMRMDRQQEITAADVVNRSSEKELAQLFIELGEERRHPAERIARALVRARPLHNTGQLAEVVEKIVPRTGKLHPATRVFQALRMATNDEPGELAEFLGQSPQHLRVGGRWVVIAFQSLDDRQVKLKFRELGQKSQADILTKHVVKPGVEEIRKNPPSRSAVLRALEWRSTQ